MFEKNAVLHWAGCSVIPVGRVVSVFEKREVGQVQQGYNKHSPWLRDISSALLPVALT